MEKRSFADKGHGGIDSGAVGGRLQEKQLTHKIV
jgi:N-acetylmuramoyl-L-alanine amidase